MFKTKVFARFARHESIADADLCEAMRRAERGLIDADLGGGLIKQRVARPKAGRSSGFRTLLAYRAFQRCVFVYGFAKSDRANIDPEETRRWRKLGNAILDFDPRTLDRAIATGELDEVNCDDE